MVAQVRFLPFDSRSANSAPPSGVIFKEQKADIHSNMTSDEIASVVVDRMVSVLKEELIKSNKFPVDPQDQFDE